MSIEQHLELPPGGKPLQTTNAFGYRYIQQALETLFELWGYDPIETPLLDYYDIYRDIIPASDARDTYRITDRRGQILLIRPDTTLFLAKQLSMYQRHNKGNASAARVYYNEQIIRFEEENEIPTNEYQQTGIELTGVTGIHGDTEILLLAAKSLQALHISEKTIIHIGSRRILHSIAKTYHIQDIEQFITHVRKRRIPAHLPDNIKTLLAYIGSPEQFTELLESLAKKEPLSSTIYTAAKELTDTIACTVQALRSTKNIHHHPLPKIRIDISETGSHDYYTGMAFSAYLVEKKVLQGGRYDNLFAAFGVETPAVGFSMFIRKLPPHILPHQTQPVKTAPSQHDITARLQFVQQEHRKGNRASL